MIVSHAHRFVFVGLPKTASTSVAIALSQWCGPDDIITRIAQADEAVRASLGYRGPQNDVYPWYAYPLVDLLRALIKRRRLPQYKHPTAAAVRRLIGHDLWRRYYSFCVERNPFDRAISRYFYDARLGRPLPPVNDYVCALDDRRLSHWHRYTDGDRVIVSQVIRYEQLHEELKPLADRLGVARLDLPHTKHLTRSDRRHYSHVLNGAARRRIERACGREIERWGYQWVDAP